MIRPNIARRPGWEGAFAAALEAAAAAPFAWGRADCLTLVGDVTLAMTGHDPMADFRGRYDTAAGARAKLREAGYRSLREALSAHFPPIAPALARRGDCGLVDMPLGLGRAREAAVIVANHMVIGRGPAGAVWLPRGRLLHAYRIG